MIEVVNNHVADLALIADLFEYPRSGFVADAQRAAREVSTEAARQQLSAFAADVASMQPELLEEAHVRTFLVAPAAAPYVGVHLFGEESFKRAHLMAQLVEQFRKVGFDAGNELPDHVAVLLRFAQHLEANECSDLLRWCLALPVTTMHASLAETRNPYRHLLAGLKACLAPDGVPESVRASIARTAQAPDQPDQAGCSGCSVKHGEDEP